MGPPSEYLYTSELARTERHHAREEKRVREQYRTHWFLWRATSVLSWITGERGDLILQGPRTVPLVKYRHVALWLAKTMGDLPYARIAMFLGCDHTTVRGACLAVERGIREGGIYRRLLEDALVAEGELDGRFA